MWYTVAMDTILVFLPFSRHVFKETLAGVARRCGDNVRIQTVDGPVRAADLAKLLAFWRPRGCIVEASEGLGVFTPERFGRTPVVYLDRTPIDDRRSLLEVRQDYAAAGEVAARELLSAEPISYAYAGYRIRTVWSDKRGDAFVATIRLHGKPCARLDAPPHGRMDPVRVRAWFTALPKPCAIFCANDIISESILGICETAGLSVPNDVAILGNDNDAAICENEKTPLSSLCPDFEQAGWLCADLLEERIRNPRLRKALRTYGIIGVIRRTSTSRPHTGNPRVLAALSLIRERAAKGPLSIDDVAAAMDCSRRVAEMLFRETTGRTIRDEIAETRFQRVCTLLRNPKRRIGPLAQFCGYGTETALRIAFKKRTGLSMRAYRDRESK